MTDHIAAQHELSKPAASPNEDSGRAALQHEALRSSGKLWQNTMDQALKDGFGVDGAGDYPAVPELRFNKCMAEQRAENDQGKHQTKCTEDAIKNWDLELNVRYHQLIDAPSDLSKNEQAALKQSEREWVAHKNAEFKLDELMYGGEPGDPLNLATAKMNLLKERAEELKRHILSDESF